MQCLMFTTRKPKPIYHGTGKNTKPELLVRRFLFKEGFRYRIHVCQLPGKPDIILKKYKAVILINGCFWHGHVGCKYRSLPKTRFEWWKIKLKQPESLTKGTYELENLGWRVHTIFECELKPQNIESTLKECLIFIKNESTHN